MTSGFTPSRIALSVASGIAYALAFPPFDLDAFAFVALVPLLIAVRGCGRAEAVILGWLAGTIGCTSLVAPSIFTAATRYFGETPALATVLALAIPQLYGAVYFGVFGLCARELQVRLRRPLPLVLALPTAWAACEVARTRLGTGCPWVLLAHTQHARLWLLQLADLGGAPAVSWMVALVNAAVACAIADPTPSPRVPAASSKRTPARAARDRLATFAVAGVMLAAAWVYGMERLATWSHPAGPGLRVAVVRAEVPDAWRSSLQHVQEVLARYEDLMRQVAPSGPDLIVWPENAVSVSVDANADVFARAVTNLGPESRLLIGSPRAVPLGPGRSALRNSAFLLDHSTHITGIYDKLRLTPYGEFIPWLARPFIGAAQLGAIDYTPGDHAELLEVAGRRFATVICYEAIYADLVRTLIRAGAEFLVNISNDAWFDDTAAVMQHFRAAQMRAVETRRYLVRAANGGISAIVDPSGAIVAEARHGPVILEGSIVPLAAESPYVQFGDAFGWACVGITLALLLPRGPRT